MIFLYTNISRKTFHSLNIYALGFSALRFLGNSSCWTFQQGTDVGMRKMIPIGRLWHFSMFVVICSDLPITSRAPKTQVAECVEPFDVCSTAERSRTPASFEPLPLTLLLLHLCGFQGALAFPNHFIEISYVNPFAWLQSNSQNGCVLPPSLSLPIHPDDILGLCLPNY